jgi:hypothetical protein
LTEEKSSKELKVVEGLASGSLGMGSLAGGREYVFGLQASIQYENQMKEVATHAV